MGSRWSAKKEPPPPTLKLNISDLHPIVAIAARAYLKVTPDWDGTYAERSASPLKLRVAPGNLERALVLADRLFKAAEARGHKIGSNEKDKEQGADVIVDGEAVRVVVKEKLESRMNKGETHRWRKRIFVPTGLLMFVLGDGYGSKPECGDSTRWKAEDRIEKTLEKIEELARRQKENRIRWEKERKEAEARWQREQEEEERRLEEKRRGEEFLALITDWRKASEVRAFITLLRQTAKRAKKPIDPSSDLGKRITWAEKYADRLDPLANYPTKLSRQDSAE